jgi:hypothetical protein
MVKMEIYAWEKTKLGVGTCSLPLSHLAYNLKPPQNQVCWAHLLWLGADWTPLRLTGAEEEG